MKKYEFNTRKETWYVNMGHVHDSIFVKGIKKDRDLLCEVMERWKS